MEHLEEPWLRGPIPGVHPLVAPVLYAFRQAREDLARWTAPLTLAELWAEPNGFGSPGFHIRHIGGSARRLMAYVQGRSLTDEELAAVRREHEAGATRDELLAELDAALTEAEAIIRSLDPSTLTEARTVGRKNLPSTVIGLLTHIAEHTQRHTGQAISEAKWRKAANVTGIS